MPEEGQLRKVRDEIFVDLAEIASQFPKTDQEALTNLASDPAHRQSLLVLYENHRQTLKRASDLILGLRQEARRRATINLLVGVARRAGEFDPTTMDASDWIRSCANAEARRLRRVIRCELR